MSDAVCSVTRGDVERDVLRTASSTTVVDAAVLDAAVSDAAVKSGG